MGYRKNSSHSSLYESDAARYLRNQFNSMNESGSNPFNLSRRTSMSDTNWSTFDYASIGYGIFAQDDPATSDSKFNYLKNDFGLILPGSWPALSTKLACLQEDADRIYHNSHQTIQTKYKVIFVARHGQGYHNLAIEIYGQKAWDEYWSKIDTDGNIVWGPDPELTPLGIEQAKRNNLAWKKQISEKSAPVPQVFFVSPFTRATDTAMYTWANITKPAVFTPAVVMSHFQRSSNATASADAQSTTSTISTVANVLVSPNSRNETKNDAFDDKQSLSSDALVVENLRETIGVHTCDKRSTKSQIHARHPHLYFEPGFSENDNLWTAEYREKPAEQDERIREFLDGLFGGSSSYETPVVPYPSSDDIKFVSVTAHSGTINSILRVIHHRPFNVPPGGMIPVIIKATRYKKSESE